MDVLGYLFDSEVSPNVKFLLSLLSFSLKKLLLFKSYIYSNFNLLNLNSDYLMSSSTLTGEATLAGET